MPRLKQRKSDWPVVEGRRVKPYEIPADPVRDELELRHMVRMDRRREELDRTGMSRALRSYVIARRERRGLLFGHLLFNGRLLVEARARGLGGCDQTELLLATSKWEWMTTFRKAV